ncbi:PDR/VanB family oxidoreductase [Microbacterium sp. A588]
MSGPESLDDEQDLRLVVSERTEVAAGVMALTLRSADGADLPMWNPGSHIDVHLGKDLVRQYSLSGDPTDRSAWQIAVLREPQGRGGSAHMHDQVEVGTILAARGPRNHFTLEPADSYVFIAGGIGITPILPMVREAQQRGASWRLYYGGRNLDSMGFRNDLEAYGDRVKILPQDTTGFLDLPTILDSASGATVYCCGPTSLLTAVEERAAERDLELHTEHFRPKEIDESPNTSIEVYLEMSDITLVVPPDRSILELVEEAGIDVISSCREGTCGSCETPVLSGAPDHRDSLLSPSICDAMMICVSRSKTPRIVLDL